MKQSIAPHHILHRSHAKLACKETFHFKERLESAFLNAIKAHAKMRKVQLIRYLEYLVPLRGFFFFYICANHFGEIVRKGTHVIRTLIFTLRGKRSQGEQQMS